MTSLRITVTYHVCIRGTQNTRFPCVIKEPYERQAIYTIVVGFNYNSLNLCYMIFYSTSYDIDIII